MNKYLSSKDEFFKFFIISAFIWMLIFCFELKNNISVFRRFNLQTLNSVSIWAAPEEGSQLRSS